MRNVIITEGDVEMDTDLDLEVHIVAYFTRNVYGICSVSIVLFNPCICTQTQSFCTSCALLYVSLATSHTFFNFF
jgi:hypothetical protein